MTILASALFLYSQDTPKLDIIKKISLSINKNNAAVFSFAGSAPEIVPPRTYKKLISTGSDIFLVSYGLNMKMQPTLYIQLKSSQSSQVILEFSPQTISMTPGSFITITFGDTDQNTTLTPSLNGEVRLNNQILSDGITVSLSLQRAPAPAPTLEQQKKIVQDQDLTSSTKSSLEPTVPRAPPTVKSIERRKIQIEELRETTSLLRSKEKKQKPEVIPKNEPVIREITIQQNQDLEPSLIRENQVLLQLSTGLQNILDQITNNPLSADDTFQLGLPPLPPASPRPPLASFNEWISKLQSENSAYRKKAVKTREQLTQFLNSLTKPSYRLSPIIPETIEELARLARAAYKQQDWNEAATQYQNALKTEPNSLHLLSNLGVVYFSQGNYEAAEKILLQTVQQAPHDSFSYSILGICYLQRDQLENAIDALFLSVNMNPLDAQSQNYLAMTLTKKGWLTAAEEHARESIQLNPNYSEAHYNLAQIYANQKPMARVLAKKHYNLSVNIGGSRDEALETLLQIEPPKAPPTEPQIQVNPSTP